MVTNLEAPLSWNEFADYLNGNLPRSFDLYSTTETSGVILELLRNGFGFGAQSYYHEHGSDRLEIVRWLYDLLRNNYDIEIRAFQIALENHLPLQKEPTMLETLIKLYHSYMLQDVRSPIPHLAGPPGVGKSEGVQRLADLLGVQLHTVNVSRISPLELEGVQMPTTEDGKLRLDLLHSTLWTQLQEGDIVLLDEFLRGFPEVYNGLLDIMTSREVAGYALPKVFFVAASNSITTYDSALEDRLLHLFVRDARSSKSEREHISNLLLQELGLNPALLDSQEMETLLTREVLPTYEILDQFKGRSSGNAVMEGSSLRKLIGQARLREVQSIWLRELLALNNGNSASSGHWQYYFVTVPPAPEHVTSYRRWAARVLETTESLTRLSEVQQVNIRLNLALLDMQEESTRKESS